MPKKPGMATIKTLFAHSCNRCAFPGCDEALTHPEWRGVRADIAHIRGEKPGAARYAPDMNDDDRVSIDNLMLLCPNHHREIDRLRPQDWSAERLMQIKIDHETNCGNPTWTNDSELEYLASLLFATDAEDNDDSQEHREQPRLVVRDGVKDTFDVWNAGDVDAFDVTVRQSPDSPPSGILRCEDGVMRRVSPGGHFRGGLSIRTMGDAGPAIARVTWHDGEGNEYDGDFPV